MADIVFPDGSAPLFNPGVYGGQLNGASAEAGKTSGSRPGRAAKKRSFRSLFEKTVPPDLRELPPSEESVQRLLDEIHSLGDALSKRPFLEEIKDYRQAVGNFIHYVVENGLAMEEHTSGVNLLKRKKFTLVQVIDKKLEDMAAVILKNQAGQLEILAALDEIHGLLVDLLE
ncbi:MAG: YaaR family protein [Treponema sp.]|jgi:uncharacterized protein YaaR (DUF327 family)|nr:YaaR family protein [Treponema sp.]